MPSNSEILDRLPDPKLSENSLTVLNRRYLQKNSEGKVIETPKQMFWRVASFVASNETRYNPKANTLARAIEFYEIMASLDFLPNSPTLMNAGRPLGQLAACFVLPIEDSMEGIFEAVKQAALVHKSGGGTGFSFSRLRPKSSMVASTTGTASGPVSFMAVFNAATEAIKQGGTRRGANMGILRVDHPDILEFINCKKDNSAITNFNISVAITDKFMEALFKGESYDLVAPHTGQVVRTEKAQDIFDLIAQNAWLNGEPGVIFIDEINRCEKTPEVGLVEATNPCGEQPLLPYESCNLGSVNLNNMLKENSNGMEIDYEHLRKIVRLAVRFLDNIIDLNKYPIEAIKQMTLSNRRIGLGVMGFADMLYALKIPYNSEQALETASQIICFIQKEARQMSNELAVERGPFPNIGKSLFDYPTRNSTVTTIAPTGTISMIANTSGGIEPNFALCYVKCVMDNDKLLYINPRFEETAKKEGWYSKELMEKIAAGTRLADLTEIPETARQVFVTAHEISPEYHIRMQSAFQKCIDNAVSKTINFPREATVQDVKNAYLLAWKLKCKGITIYRDGSRSHQVMNVGDALIKNEKPTTQLSYSEITKENARIAPHMINALEHFTTKPSLKPRPRPRVTRGYTEQIKTGEGTLYVTINEDEYGLCEVFASIGKVGGSAMAQSEAIGRLISLALRSGVDPHSIVHQLKGITGPTPVWFEGELIRSIPDAIARVIEKYLKEREQKQGELPLGPIETVPISVLEKPPDASAPFEIRIKYANGFDTKALCPDCNSPLAFEEGCIICHSCGYSKCE